MYHLGKRRIYLYNMYNNVYIAALMNLLTKIVIYVYDSERPPTKIPNIQTD